MEAVAIIPMEQWSNNAIFLACLASATLGGFASLLRSETPITIRVFFAYLLWFGMAGLATSLVGFELLGGRKRPWVVIGIATFVGMGIVKTTALIPYFLKVLKVASTQGTDDDDK